MRKPTIKDTMIQLMNQKIQNAIELGRTELLLYKELVPAEDREHNYLNYSQNVALSYLRALLPIKYVKGIAYADLMPIIIEMNTRRVLFEKCN